MNYVDYEQVDNIITYIIGWWLFLWLVSAILFLISLLFTNKKEKS